MCGLWEGGGRRFTRFTPLPSNRRCVEGVWSLSSFNVRSSVPGGLVSDWWEFCSQQMEEDEWGAFWTTVWAIWGARFKWLMEGDQREPTETLSYALKINNEVSSASPIANTSGVVLLPFPTGWSKPKASYVKVNTDAGQIGSLGCGIGVVCRDEFGEVLATGTFEHQVESEPRVAEAKAIFYGMKLALELGYSCVEVESDSLMAIQALRSDKGGSSEFNLIIDDVLALVSSFNNVIRSFVKRLRNKVTHMLTHFQPWELGKHIWDKDISLDEIAIVLKDII
ncbi:uncharacterized protein LOC109135632 [Beta vulgaris subsp. vulgaris]|uniref:uncharacterized protein LOC109135632 n=1 Tax=Beta vulgaris subsp. vulgaris TaxID=3555 RepID=UPI002036C124|nr:uncharacterized protein LOC109135632 [Beta vulgaris subsp. vulgaris]XP_048489643.1 uncharacterized protein LOC109135632 [Beta vulgaris subsp. vulgaris]XP_048489644.1 uncharacterized protein LOC109135632 [Beta vulgaris subsp. vulgaris]XP_048489645.1 uncharacterized protein LOC109135632 [Beta vulgaris subsp. vulgaris]